MSEIPTLPSTMLNPLAAAIKRDFFLSFRFSQGATNQQTKIFQMLSKRYVQGADDEQCDWFTANYVSPRWQSPEWAALGDVRPPVGSHMPMLTDGAVTAATEFRRFGLRIYGDFQDGVPDDDTQIQQDFLSETVRLDLLYIEGPKGRHHGPDPRISYAREYVIGGQRSGSPTFDGIFEEIRNNFIGDLRPDSGAVIGRWAVDLASLWELYHEGQQFWPDNAA